MLRPMSLRLALALIGLAIAARWALPIAVPLGALGDREQLRVQAVLEARALGWEVSTQPELVRLEVDTQAVHRFRWVLPEGRVHLQLDSRGQPVAWALPDGTIQRRRVAMPGHVKRQRQGQGLTLGAVVLGALAGLALLRGGERWHWSFARRITAVSGGAMVLSRGLEVDRLTWGWNAQHNRAAIYVLEFARDSTIWLPILFALFLCAARVGPPRLREGVAAGIAMAALLFASAGLAVLALSQLGLETQVQPRHLLGYLYDARLPVVSVLGYSLFAALAEETIFRHFGTGMLYERTRNPWLAILLPALVFGFMHASVDFLPTAEPLVRGALMTAVGIAWGWLYLRRGFVAVLASHLAVDLLLLSWPLWGS